MTQREFMQELLEALAEELPAAQVEEHRRFYESYFADERRKGRSEQEILEELGDPRLIAMTLIEMAALRGQNGGFSADSDYSSGSAGRGYSSGSAGSGYGSDNTGGGYGYGSGGTDRSYGSDSTGRGFPSGSNVFGGNVHRLGCGLGSLIGVVVLLALLTLVVVFLKFMLPVIAIVVIIGMILSIFRGNR